MPIFPTALFKAWSPRQGALLSQAACRFIQKLLGSLVRGELFGILSSHLVSQCGEDLERARDQ